MARLSSLVPVRSLYPDFTRSVTISDISVGDGGFRILLKFSKTLQSLEHRMVIPVLKSVRSGKSCPVLVLSKLLLALLPGAKPTTPLFAWPQLVNRLSFFNFYTVSEARTCLARCMRDLGLEDRNYTFHSFRRGGCQHGFSKGTSINDLKALGGWNSDAITAYLPTKVAQLKAAQALSN